MKRALIVLLCGIAAFAGMLLFYSAEPEQVATVELIEMPTQALDLIEAGYIVLEEEEDTAIAETRTPGPDSLFIVHSDEQMEFEDIDLFCLAKNIYHEARSEDLLGQMAVAQVTLNRVESRNYPSTVCNVVMQRFQFSWANNRAIRWTHPKGRAWEASKALAAQFLEKGVRVSGLQTALFYHADYVDPKWRDDDSVIAQVGTHIFYASAKPL